PQTADLRLDKTVDNSAPTVGDQATFTITLTNDGPNSATPVTGSDLLPAGLSFFSASPSQGTYVSGTGVWTVGSLASNASTTLAIVATVTSAALITNTAQVSDSGEFDPDSTPGHSKPAEEDQDSVTLAPVPQTADLRLDKVVDNATPTVGDQVTFTITLVNDGPNTATHA